MIIQRAINDAFDVLKKNNIKTAMLDSEILMTKALKKKKRTYNFKYTKQYRKKKIWVL